LADLDLKLVDLGLYSRKVVKGGRRYNDRTISVQPANAIHKTNRTYDRRKFERKFATYLQLSYGES